MTFIAFEGGEGVGKSTQLTMLKEWASQFYLKRSFVFTREPGGSPLAESIRTLILSDEAARADGLTMFGLFAAARADHVRTLIRPRLAAGGVVVTDRFVGSSFAYQAYAQEETIPMKLFRAHCASIGVMPTLTLIFDMDPAEALTRLIGRQDASNHFDARGIEFHLRLQEGYRRYGQFLKENGKCVVFIDAAKPPEEVHRQVLKEIDFVL